ncbi:DUF1345 domain-containing protein [Reyranella sp.]|uniref:DUF1345 domain-containing protein n=1 Tax=Reyranella sp. TaxID=1929291 RepID=UPI003C7BC635
MARTAVPSERFLRFVKGRQRLLLSIAAGAIAFMALPAEMRLNTQLLISWDVLAILYVGTTFRMIWVSNVDICRRHAKFNDEGGGIILMIVVISASASFAAGHLEEWACQRPAVHGTGRFVGSAWLGERHQRLFAS